MPNDAMTISACPPATKIGVAAAGVHEAQHGPCGRQITLLGV